MSVYAAEKNRSIVAVSHMNPQSFLRRVRYEGCREAYAVVCGGDLRGGGGVRVVGGDAALVTRLERVEATGEAHREAAHHGDAIRRLSDRNLLSFYREFVNDDGVFYMGVSPVHGRLSRITAHLVRVGLIMRVRSYRGSVFRLTEYGWDLLGEVDAKV